MVLYVCQIDPMQDRNSLITKALKDYNNRKSLALNEESMESAVIIRDSKGKPYFQDLGVHFSVSHSGHWWSCLMSGEPVGLDIEVLRERENFLKIAERFFTKEESEFVEQNGIESFFEIWVRKEAYIKYVGTGISEGLSSFAVVKDSKFLNHIKQSFQGNEKKEGYLKSIEISPELKAAFCTENQKVIEEIVTLH